MEKREFHQCNEWYNEEVKRMRDCFRADSKKFFDLMNHSECGFKKNLKLITNGKENDMKTKKDQFAIEFAELILNDFEMVADEETDDLLWELIGTSQRYTSEQLLEYFKSDKKQIELITNGRVRAKSSHQRGIKSK